MPISLLSLIYSVSAASKVFAWGALGHKIIAQYGTGLVDRKILASCHVTAAQIIEHTNDPDVVWRNQRWQHPDEAHAHFFHIDRQPTDWKTRTAAKDRSQGYLVYRLVDWIEDAKKQKQKQDWDKLAQELYGISHYAGDLTQPLHLNHDYDGDGAGLPDLHAQFETKMLNRYEEEARQGVNARLHAEGVPSYWSGAALKDLIFTTAEQAAAKVPRLFEGSRAALQSPNSSARKKHRHYSQGTPSRRFVKSILWRDTGALAMDQLAIGARIWAKALSSICQ